MTFYTKFNRIIYSSHIAQLYPVSIIGVELYSDDADQSMADDRSIHVRNTRFAGWYFPANTDIDKNYLKGDRTYVIDKLIVCTVWTAADPHQSTDYDYAQR